MNYLIAVDQEGANRVVGLPYQGLPSGSEEYGAAVAETTAELNTVVSALYELGADKVYVWDNHGTGHNLDFDGGVDPRAVNVGLDADGLNRMNIADGLDICGVIFLGYHAKAGTLGGVLAHTYNSTTIQYYKIDGRQEGEFFIDSAIAAGKGIPTLMLVGDDKCVLEAKEVSDGIVTVTTKYGISRNEAKFRESGELHAELKEAVKRAVKIKKVTHPLKLPAEVEIRYTRVERAAEVKAENSRRYGIEISYGEDAHTLKFTAKRIEDIKVFL